MRPRGRHATAAELGEQGDSQGRAERGHGRPSRQADRATAAGGRPAHAATGVLAYHVTVRGTNPATGEPVLQRGLRRRPGRLSGAAVQRHQDAAEQHTGAAEGRHGTTAAPRSARAATPTPPPASGTGVKLDGTKVDLDAHSTRHARQYVLSDQRAHGRHQRTPSPPGTRAATGRQRGVGCLARRASRSSAHPASDFGKDATEAGAVDAHWAAGQVYDYYKTNHGRDSLDGRGMTVNSLVGVT